MKRNTRDKKKKLKKKKKHVVPPMSLSFTSDRKYSRWMTFYVFGGSNGETVHRTCFTCASKKKKEKTRWTKEKVNRHSNEEKAKMKKENK